MFKQFSLSLILNSFSYTVDNIREYSKYSLYVPIIQKIDVKG